MIFTSFKHGFIHAFIVLKIYFFFYTLIPTYYYYY